MIHILFLLNPSRSDSLAVLDKLNDVFKQLRNGKDFTTVFRQYNTNDMLGETDGYMVWQKPEDMLDSFRNYMADLTGVLLRSRKQGTVQQPPSHR